MCECSHTHTCNPMLLNRKGYVFEPQKWRLFDQRQKLALLYKKDTYVFFFFVGIEHWILL